MSKRKKGHEEEKKKNQIAAGSARFDKKGIRITSFIGNKGLVVLFLFLLSFGVFAPSLESDFVWDDIERIKDSYYKLNLSDINYKTLFPWLGKGFKGKHYRPILQISTVIDNEVWGASPFGFHLSNIIFHSVSTVLFYFMVVLILGGFMVERKESIAFLSSLLFALHPIHIESVSFISARADLLCSVFFFLAFIFNILSYRRLWFFILSVFCFYLSLLSKEVAIAFPLVAIGFDLISGRFRSRNSILKYSIYCLLFFGYFYYRPTILEHIWRLKWVNFFAVLKVLLSSYLFYIEKLVFPFSLNPFITNLPEDTGYLVFSIIVIMFLCAISFISIRKKEGITAFSVFWVLTTLGPHSLVAVFRVASTPLAERFLYIPSAGFCMLLGYLLLEAAKRMKSQKIAWAFGFLLCIFYLFFIIEGQSIWRDELSLWKYASKKSPDHASPHLNYGVALSVAGKGDEAIRELLVAFEPGVNSGKTQRTFAANNLGLVYLNNKKDYENAEKWFNKAIFYDPKFYMAYYHLGVIYFKKGKSRNSVSDYRKAEEYLKSALVIHGSDGRSHLFLAEVYIGLSEREKARNESKMALQSGLIEPLAKRARYILEITED